MPSSTPTKAAVEAAAAARRQRLADRIARGVRVCGRCRVEKLLSEFGPGPEPDGRRSYCRSCCAACKRDHTKRLAADAAGAVDEISVRKRSKPPSRSIIPPSSEHAHAPLASRDPRTRARYLVYGTDPIDEFCISCTAVWGATGWEHDPSCAFRRFRRRP